MLYKVPITEDYDAYLQACEAEQRRHDLKRKRKHEMSEDEYFDRMMEEENG